MHEMGFEMQTAKKGSYVDSNENMILLNIERMVALGFWIKVMHPLMKQKAVLPTDLECPLSEIIDKTVIFFNDESTF